jgi:hypothetical protein
MGTLAGADLGRSHRVPAASISHELVVARGGVRATCRTRLGDQRSPRSVAAKPTTSWCRQAAEEADGVRITR